MAINDLSPPFDEDGEDGDVCGVDAGDAGEFLAGFEAEGDFLDITRSVVHLFIRAAFCFATSCVR